jgi:hypothetical protein
MEDMTKMKLNKNKGIFSTLILTAIIVIAALSVYVLTSYPNPTTGEEKVEVQSFSITATETGFSFSVWAKSAAGTYVTVDSVIIKDNAGIIIAEIFPEREPQLPYYLEENGEPKQIIGEWTTSGDNPIENGKYYTATIVTARINSFISPTAQATSATT